MCFFQFKLCITENIWVKEASFFWTAENFIQKISSNFFQIVAAKRKHVLVMAFSKLSRFEHCRLGMSLQRHMRFDYVVVLHPSAVHWHTAGSWSSFSSKFLFESSRAKELWVLTAFIFMWPLTLTGFVEDTGPEEPAQQHHTIVTLFSCACICLHQFSTQKQTWNVEGEHPHLN